jgi:hypothetical protein
VSGLVSLLLFAALFYLMMHSSSGAYAVQKYHPSHNWANGRPRHSVFCLLSAVGAIFAAVAFSAGASGQVAPPRMSGIYLTATDYKDGRVAFEGDCGSKTHKLELHDVLHKSYIDVTHGTEKHRYAKSDLFGFRACDGRDYRFASKLEYQILEAKELYIYAREISVSRGKGSHSVRKYYFSAGPDGQILALTLENLKQAFPDNHRFHDSLDVTFGAGQKLAEFDEFHQMFKVNRLLIASREQEP